MPRDPATQDCRRSGTYDRLPEDLNTKNAVIVTASHICIVSFRLLIEVTINTLHVVKIPIQVSLIKILYHNE